MENKTIQLPESWLKHLKDEFNKPYMVNLKEKLQNLKKNKIIFYPPGSLIFNSFNLTPLEKIKVVILGQDPYHGPGQAHGLCFSVPEGVRPPPSLLNIYKELESDLDKKVNIQNGNLEAWANQGVFLLNTTLTVEKSKPLSHQDLGWSEFTDTVISLINKELENIVFILWGSHAQSKKI